MFLISKVGPGGETSDEKRGPYTGYIRDSLVDGFFAARPSAGASVIRGDGPQHTVRGVVIRDFYVAGRPVRTAADARIEVGPDASEVTFKATDVVPSEVSAMRLPNWVK